MSLDTLQPTAPSAPAPPGADPSGWARYFSWDAQRQQPRWLLPLVVVALCATLMPVVHAHTYGLTRLVDATVQQVQQAAHADVGADGRAMIQDDLVLRGSMTAAAAIPFLLTALAIILAGFMLNMGGLLLGADLSAAQALAAAAMASLVEMVYRVAMWAFITWSVGLDQAVAPDWRHVAPLHAGLALDGAHGAVLTTALAAVDMYTLCGVAVSSYAVRRLAPDVSWGGALFASSVWVLLVSMLKLTVAASFDIPLF